MKPGVHVRVRYEHTDTLIFKNSGYDTIRLGYVNENFIIKLICMQNT